MNHSAIIISLVVSAGAAFGQVTKKETMRGVNRNAPAPTAGTLVVGINANIGTLTEPGWPLIITATVKDATPAAPFPADPQLKMTNESGSVVALNFEAVPAPAIATEPARYWFVAESETSRLSPGRYRIALLSTATGWRIEPGEIRVLAPDPARAGFLPLLRIHRLLLQNREDDALAEADRELAANARNLQAWIAKGDILMKKDDPDKAVEAYEQARNLHLLAGRDSYPILRRLKSAQTRALEKRGVVPAQQPP